MRSGGVGGRRGTCVRRLGTAPDGTPQPGPRHRPPHKTPANQHFWVPPPATDLARMPAGCRRNGSPRRMGSACAEDVRGRGARRHPPDGGRSRPDPLWGTPPDGVHAQSRVHASAREIPSGMAVTLAQRLAAAPAAPYNGVLAWRNSSSKAAPRCPARSACRQQERRAADPRRLPADRGRGRAAQRAADPRRRGDARAPRGLGRACRLARRQRGRRCAPPTSSARAVDREQAGFIRASFLVAGPLLARFGTALMPPPGGDVIGRRRLDPHLDAFRALGAELRARARHLDHRPRRRAARRRRVHGRAVGDGDRERADGRGADARRHGHPQRRLRAARAGSRAHAREDGRRHPGDRLQPADRRRRRAAPRLRARRRPRPHRDRLVHGAGRRDRRRAADPVVPAPRTST